MTLLLMAFALGIVIWSGSRWRAKRQMRREHELFMARFRHVMHEAVGEDERSAA